MATQWSISHGWGPALGAHTSFPHIFQLIHVTQKVDAFFQIFRFVNWPNVHLRTENEDLYTHFLILFNWYLSQNLHIVCVHLSTSFKKNFFPIITNTTFQTGIAFYDHIFCLLSKICNSGWQTQQEWAKLEKLWDITYYLPTSLRLRKKCQNSTHSVGPTLL